MLTFEVNQQLSNIVHTFGFWTTPLPVKKGWTGEFLDLSKAVEALFADMRKYPDGIKAIELY